MNTEIYRAIFPHYSSGTINWEEQRQKFGYNSKEQLRSQFRRERKRRGDPARMLDDGVANSDRVLDLPKIGVMDIESLPGKKYFWSLWEENGSPTQVIEDVCLLSWAAKFIDDDTMYSDIMTPKEALSRNPERVALSAYEFLSKCEIVIGHNWKGYDGKMLNTFFLMYARPVKYRTVDTLEVAKSTFKFSSNSMKFINDKLGIRNKIENEGFPLWDKCSNGDQEALNTMLDYNCGDILSTESLFWRLQPFISNLPNFQTYRMGDEERGCHCGSYDIKKVGNWYTNLAVYEKLRCNDCGALMRGKKNLLDKEKRETLLVRL
jgi:hypothetical protein